MARKKKAKRKTGKKTKKKAAKKRSACPKKPTGSDALVGVDAEATARRIEELSDEAAAAERKFHRARKRGDMARNESLLVRREIGELVALFAEGATYGSDKLGQLADQLRGVFSRSSLEPHARFASVPEDKVEELVEAGRPWRWVCKELARLVPKERKRQKRRAPDDRLEL